MKYQKIMFINKIKNNHCYAKSTSTGLCFIFFSLKNIRTKKMFKPHKKKNYRMEAWK